MNYQYISNMSNESLLSYLYTSDSLDRDLDKQKDVFSYFTEDKLYIVFPVPSAGGYYETISLNYEVK